MQDIPSKVNSRMVLQYTIVSALLVTLLSGCVSTNLEKMTDKQVDNHNIVGYQPELQLVILESPHDKNKLCLAPAPDADAGATSSISLGAADESIAESSGMEIQELGGRSPSVLLARDLLYRSCEFSMNYHLDKNEARSLYMETLNRVERIISIMSGAETSE